MLGYFKMVDFLNVFAAVEEDDVELNYSVIDSEDDLILLAAVSSFMRRSLNRVNGFFEATIPAYLPGEFKSHFRMTRQTCELLAQEIVHTGRIPTGNTSGRPTILPEKQILLFLWSVANKEPYRTIADRFDVSISSAHRAIRRVTQGVIDLCGRYIKWPNGDYSLLLTEMHTYFDVKQ